MCAAPARTLNDPKIGRQGAAEGASFYLIDPSQRRRFALQSGDEILDGARASPDTHENALAIVENLACEVEFVRNAPDRRAKTNALHPAPHPDFHGDEFRLLPDVLRRRHCAASQRSTQAGETGASRRGSVDRVHGSSSGVAEVLVEIRLEGAANKAGDLSGERGASINATTINYGFTIQYSLLYFKSHVSVVRAWTTTPDNDRHPALVGWQTDNEYGCHQHGSPGAQRT